MSEIIAATLGLALEHTRVEDATAYGAALLAGIAAGVFANVQEAAELPQVSNVTEPDASHADRYRELHEHYRSLQAEPTESAAAVRSPRLRVLAGSGTWRGGEL